MNKPSGMKTKIHEILGSAPFIKYIFVQEFEKNITVLIEFLGNSARRDTRNKYLQFCQKVLALLAELPEFKPIQYKIHTKYFSERKISKNEDSSNPNKNSTDYTRQ